MTANPERTGCARPIEWIAGAAAGWSCGAIFFGRFAAPPRQGGRAELYGALFGALLGIFLPRLVAGLERIRIPRDASLTVFSLATAAILGTAFKKVLQEGCISGVLALSFAACMLFFLDAVVGRSAGIITPLVRGARKQVVSLLLKAAAGLLIGLVGGMLRVHLKVVAVTDPAQAKFFGVVLLIAGALSYPLVILVFRGRKALAGLKAILPIVDGLLFALCLEFIMMQPTPSLSPSWASSIERPNWIWIPMGMFVGVMVAFLIGGIQSILLLLVDNAAGRYFSGLLVDAFREVSGRPKRAADPDPPLTPGQRTASSLLGAMAFCGVVCFGLMALCFGGGKDVITKDNGDVARLPAGCPPSCARVDASTWHLARAVMRGADFEEATLRGTMLDGADLAGAKFRRARMKGVRLTFAQLSHADFRDADLDGAILTGADLRQASLRNANLQGALLQSSDLSTAILDHADLRGAVFDAATLWPRRFDPKAAGARMDGESPTPARGR